MDRGAARAGGLLHGPETPHTLCATCARSSAAAPTSWWVKVVAARGQNVSRAEENAPHAAATARLTGAPCGPFKTGISVRGLPLCLRMSGKDAKNEPFEVRCTVGPSF